MQPRLKCLRTPAVDREVRRARLATAQAALAALTADAGDEAEMFRARLRVETQATSESRHAWPAAPSVHGAPR